VEVLLCHFMNNLAFFARLTYLVGNRRKACLRLGHVLDLFQMSFRQDICIVLEPADPDSKWLVMLVVLCWSKTCS
jgi:hypothetical protein